MTWTPMAVVLAMSAAWLAVGSVHETRMIALTSSRSAGAPPRIRMLAIGVIGRIGFGPASRRRRAHERGATIEALGALAAELAAGQPPRTALERAAGTPPAWPSANAAVRMDGDIPAALRLDARRRPVLAQLAACWQVAAQTGSGLASAVDQLTLTARRAEQVRIELEGQLAAPRATARLLSALPVLGIGFGVLLGADPVGWLLTSALGRVCLVGGLALTVVGAWWTGRIARRVERML